MYMRFAWENKVLYWVVVSYVLVLLLYINFILVIWHPDCGHRIDRNILGKKNYMWLNIFLKAHLLIYHKVNSSYVYFEAFNSVQSCGQFLLFISSKCTSCVKYIYLSPITSYMFRCLLHLLQKDHCIICSRLCMAPDILIKKWNRVHFTFYSTICVTKLRKAHISWTNNGMVPLKMV